MGINFEIGTCNDTPCDHCTQKGRKLCFCNYEHDGKGEPYQITGIRWNDRNEPYEFPLPLEYQKGGRKFGQAYESCYYDDQPRGKC